jgi:hypothetical protein
MADDEKIETPPVGGDIDGRFARIEDELAAVKSENAKGARKLAELKASNAALAAEIASLKPKPVQPPKPIEPVVKISYPVAASSSPMPTDDELRRLREIVTRYDPALGDCSHMGIHRASRYQNETEWVSQFRKSFVGVGKMYRLPEPDRKHHWYHFKDLVDTALNFGPFVAACLAHGDVPWTDWRIDGQVLELGLSEYSIGREASDSWRKVLANRQLLAPSPPAVRMAPRSPSRVIVDDYANW